MSILVGTQYPLSMNLVQFHNKRERERGGIWRDVGNFIINWIGYFYRRQQNVCVPVVSLLSSYFSNFLQMLEVFYLLLLQSKVSAKQE